MQRPLIMFKVLFDDNNNKQEIYIYGDKSLLTELEQENIIISHNCRQGHCGSCVLQLLKGNVIHNKSLVPLSQDEILACQCKPISDLSISTRT